MYILERASSSANSGYAKSEDPMGHILVTQPLQQRSALMEIQMHIAKKKLEEL
jgi:hypothetical protein